MKAFSAIILFFSFIFFSLFLGHTTRAQTALPIIPVIAPIKILLVPGHDSEVWGAQYGNLKEATMNLAISNRVYDILKLDNRFEVHVTRDKDGYTQEFADYFALQQAEITAFKEDAKERMQEKISSGAFIEKENTPHNSVSEDIANRLYGFNKWANENNIDAMIHIHFNDYPRPYKWTMGKYKGFAIYIPEEQMANSTESVRLAAFIFLKLKEKYTTSTYEKEKAGLVPDQKLIALGANDTLLPSVRSILIEYGYIYSLGDSAARQTKYETMSQLTAEGIKNYFFHPTSPSP